MQDKLKLPCEIKGGVSVLSLFDGMSCGMLAFLKLGIEPSNYYAYEIDKYAIKTTKHNFPNIKQCGDVFEADFTEYNGVDYLIGGSPCFTKGHLVLTNKGYKDISEIKIGDMVLTHKNRFMPVVRLYKHESNTINLKLMGYPSFTVTPNHPFYTIEKMKCNEKEYLKTHSWRKFSKEPQWKAAEKLDSNSFCGRHCINNTVSNLNISDEELWLVGRYVADGSLYFAKRSDRKNGFRHQVIISCGESKVEDFKSHIKTIPFSCYPHSQGVYRCEFNSKKIYDLINDLGCGRGAYNKQIPISIMDLPKEKAQIFLDGYISGDGCYIVESDSYSLSTVSPKLAFGLQRIIALIYGVNAGVGIAANNREHKIDERIIKANYPLYTITFKKDRRKQSVYHVQDNIIWTPFKQSERTNKIETVYNIEVEEDHSYTVNNCIVKNCTYWSIAQSPDKRETTASGLGWELFSQYVRALNEAKPKYFLYENNKSMSKAIYKSISEAFGFEPILINSALVSAQNRNRYYWCGKRNDDGTYSKVDIPQPEDKGILLKDVLDNAIRFSRKIGVCEPKDKSLVICASDWRGINRNQVQNAVAEPVNTTDEGKSQTIKAQYQRTSIANICKYISTYGASGVAEPVGTTKDGKSYCLTSGYANGSGENIGNYAVHTLEKGCKSMAAEPVCMRYERSETAKRLRKDYESGKIKHGFHEHSELHPRTDGKSNTLSTVLKDNPICEPVNTTKDSKAQCLRATCYKDTVRNIVGNDIDRKTGVAEKVSVLPKLNNEPSTPPIETQFEFQDLNIRDKSHIAINENAIRGVQDKNNASCAENFYEFTDTKANTLTTAHKPKIIDELDNYKRYAEPCEWNDNGEPTKAISFADGKKYVVYSIVDGQIEIKGKTYPIKLKDGYYIIRKLTVKECMRLQTVPEWYDFSAISQTQAYKCLGNGWTVDVIVHILKGLLNIN